MPKNIYAVLDSDDDEVQVNKATTVTEAPEKTVSKKNKPLHTIACDSDKPDRRTRNKPEGGRGPRSGHRDRGEGHSSRPRRDFDRQSGTGRGKESNKHGGGDRNWRTDKAIVDVVHAKAEGEPAKSSSVEETPVGVQEEEPDTENNEMTFEEYMALKEQQKFESEAFKDVEIRQVVNEFENTVALTKDDKTPDFVEPAYEKVYRERSSGRKKHFFQNVGFRARPMARSGRSGGREFNHRGHGAHKGHRNYAPNVGDKNAFPSLS